MNPFPIHISYNSAHIPSRSVNRQLKGHCIEFGVVCIDPAIGCESGVNRLGDTSAFVIPAGQLLLTGGVRPECIPSA